LEQLPAAAAHGAVMHAAELGRGWKLDKLAVAVAVAVAELWRDDVPCWGFP
jgi:hypothetical protein